MEQNTSDGLVFYLLLNRGSTEHLAGIRGWKNLKVAFEEDQLWVKGFDYVQVHSLEVKSIPFATIFYSRGAMLFIVNSLLPDRTVPSLLWTPIERALPIDLPSFNHNYFGVEEKLYMRLVPTEVESEAVAMITSITHLDEYIPSAPAMRLQGVQWAIIDKNKLLLFGTPLLPIKGDVYWMYSDFMLPAGFDFELHLLKDVLNNKMNPSHQDILIWGTDNSYFRVNKHTLKPLSIGSFRDTMEQLSLK